MRFGVGSEFAKGHQVNYVLGQWNKDEQALLNEKIKNAADAVNSFMFEGIERAMNKFNK